MLRCVAVEQDAEIRVGVHVVGAQPDGRAVRGLGLFGPADGAQQDAEIAVRVGVARIDCNGTLVLGDRLIEPCRSTAE